MWKTRGKDGLTVFRGLAVPRNGLTVPGCLVEAGRLVVRTCIGRYVRGVCLKVRGVGRRVGEGLLMVTDGLYVRTGGLEVTGRCLIFPGILEPEKLDDLLELVLELDNLDDVRLMELLLDELPPDRPLASTTIYENKTNVQV